MTSLFVLIRCDHWHIFGCHNITVCMMYLVNFSMEVESSHWQYHFLKCITIATIFYLNVTIKLRKTLLCHRDLHIHFRILLIISYLMWSVILLVQICFFTKSLKLKTCFFAEASIITRSLFLCWNSPQFFWERADSRAGSWAETCG